MKITDKLWEEFIPVMNHFEKLFGSDIPLMMTGGKTDTLREYVQRCFDESKNLLEELYGWDYSENTLY